MADNQQTWVDGEASKHQEQSGQAAEPHAEKDEVPRPQPGDPPAQQPQIQHVPQHHVQQQVSAPIHLHLQALQGHHALTPADLAALQQQHNALVLQAQQAQQDYEQREKGGAMQMAGPDAMAMHAIGQPGIGDAPQLQHQHDADYERERKEKRKLANREAARRMRQRRAAQVSTLSVANTEMKSENTTLQQQLAHLANHNRELMTENAALRQDILNLKQTMENNRAVSHGPSGASQQEGPPT